MAYIPQTPQKSWVTTAVTGATITIPDGITIAVINSSILLMALTVKMPENPMDGQPITLEFQKGVTVLSVQPNTGQSLVGTLNVAIGAITPIRLKYSGANSTWYPN